MANFSLSTLRNHGTYGMDTILDSNWPPELNIPDGDAPPNAYTHLRAFPTYTSSSEAQDSIKQAYYTAVILPGMPDTPTPPTSWDDASLTDDVLQEADPSFTSWADVVSTHEPPNNSHDCVIESKTLQTNFGATTILLSCRYTSGNTSGGRFGRPVKYGADQYFSVEGVLIEQEELESGDLCLYNTHVYSYDPEEVDGFGMAGPDDWLENFYDPVSIANVFSDYQAGGFGNTQWQTTLGRLERMNQYKDRLTQGLINQVTHNIYGKDLGGMPLTSVWTTTGWRIGHDDIQLDYTSWENVYEDYDENGNPIGDPIGQKRPMLLDDAEIPMFDKKFVGSSTPGSPVDWEGETYATDDNLNTSNAEQEEFGLFQFKSPDWGDLEGPWLTNRNYLFELSQNVQGIHDRYFTMPSNMRSLASSFLSSYQSWVLGQFKEYLRWWNYPNTFNMNGQGEADWSINVSDSMPKEHVNGTMYQITIGDTLNFKMVKFEERLKARCMDLSGSPNMYLLDEDGNAALDNEYTPLEDQDFNPNYNTVYAGVDNAEQCTISGGTWLPEDEDYPHCYDNSGSPDEFLEDGETENPDFNPNYGQEINCPPEDYMRGVIQNIPEEANETTNADGKSMYSYGSYAHINGIKFDILGINGQEIQVNTNAKVPAGSVLELEGCTQDGDDYIFGADVVPDWPSSGRIVIQDNPPADHGRITFTDLELSVEGAHIIFDDWPAILASLELVGYASLQPVDQNMLPGAWITTGIDLVSWKLGDGESSTSSPNIFKDNIDTFEEAFISHFSSLSSSASFEGFCRAFARGIYTCFNEWHEDTNFRQKTGNDDGGQPHSRITGTFSPDADSWGQFFAKFTGFGFD